jgi:catechol 2,3-dioxygenase-like lactoylglutathione lyase family enzyme
MKPLFRKIDCVSLPVPNLDEALEFYHKTLGHEIIWRDYSAVGLRLPDGEGELVLHTAPRPPEVDLMVESVPDAVRRLTSAGAELITGPFEIRIGLCAVLRDPWNNPIVILDASKGLLTVDAEKWIQIKSPNQAPLPTPVSVTPAAGAPVAPVTGAAEL